MNNKLIQGKAYSHTISHKRGITAEHAESAERRNISIRVAIGGLELGARDWASGAEVTGTTGKGRVCDYPAIPGDFG